MHSSKINTFFILRTIIFTISAGLLVSLLLQMNFPTLQETGDSLTSVWVQRQMDLADNQTANLVQHGWTYYQLDRFSEAKALMEKAYAKDNNLSALYCLGLIDLKYRKFDEGIAKFEKVLSLSPEHVPTMMALGEAYFQQRYYGKSKILFEKAVQCQPTSNKARLWLGRTYINLNEKAKARQVLNTVNTGPEAREAVALVKNF